MAERDLLFRLTIGSRFENIELVQIVLADCLERLGVEQDTCHWVDLAVREAVANAIKHGNRKDPEKRVSVELARVAEEVIVQVEDQGDGFEPERLADPVDPANLLKPGGRGIFYMRSFMDAIDYSSGSHGGTVVTLRKRIVA